MLLSLEEFHVHALQWTSVTNRSSGRSLELFTRSAPVFGADSIFVFWPCVFCPLLPVSPAERVFKHAPLTITITITINITVTITITIIIF